MSGLSVRIAAVTVGVMALTLAGCGKRGELAPVAGQPMPVKAVGAPRAATPEELRTPPTQAQPGRTDELLKRSEQRQDDPFDLPPPE